jgi:hypothetical protein
MKTGYLSAVAILISSIVMGSTVMAAPVESVESARASTSLQKIDAFLGEQLVADQLTALGLSREQARARLSKLSEAQLEQLAAQVDLIRAGGTIQSGNPNPLGPLGYFLQQLGKLLHDVYALLFTWGDVH